MKRLLYIAAGMDSGVSPDLFQAQAPIQGGVWRNIWRVSNNVRFSLGAVEKMPGFASAFTTTGASPIRGIGQLVDAGGQKLFYGDKAKLYRWNIANVADVSKAGGYSGSGAESANAPATQWVMVPWGTNMLATNGVDALQAYAGTAFADVATPFTTARVIIKNGPHVLAMNTLGGAASGPNAVEWCSADDYTDWAVTETNSAGNYIIRDLDSGIVAAAPLGEFIAIYSRETLTLGSYIGAPFYFGFRKALNGIGAVSPHSVVSVGRVNYGLSREGFFETDGSSFRFIDGPIRAYLKTVLNTQALTKVCAYHDEPSEQVIWFIPTTTSEPDAGIGYDYARGAWTLYGFGRTAAVERGVFAYPVLGAADGGIYFGNVGDDADAAALPASVETHPTDLGAPNNRKLVQMVKVGITDLTGTLMMQVGTQNRLDDAVAWSTAQTLDDGFEPVYLRQAGRYLRFKFFSDAKDTHWRMNALGVWGDVMGGRP